MRGYQFYRLNPLREYTSPPLEHQMLILLMDPPPIDDIGWARKGWRGQRPRVAPVIEDDQGAVTHGPGWVAITFTPRRDISPNLNQDHHITGMRRIRPSDLESGWVRMAEKKARAHCPEAFAADDNPVYWWHNIWCRPRIAMEYIKADAATFETATHEHPWTLATKIYGITGHWDPLVRLFYEQVREDIAHEVRCAWTTRDEYLHNADPVFQARWLDLMMLSVEELAILRYREMIWRAMYDRPLCKWLEYIARKDRNSLVPGELKEIFEGDLFTPLKQAPERSPGLRHLAFDTDAPRPGESFSGPLRGDFIE